MAKKKDNDMKTDALFRVWGLQQWGMKCNKCKIHIF